MRKLFILNCIIILSISICLVSCDYYTQHLIGGDRVSYVIDPPGAGSVNENTQDNGLVLITAEPSAGYIFDTWSGGLEGPINNYPIEYVESDIVTAHFVEEDTGTTPLQPDIVIPDADNEGILELEVPSNMQSEFLITIENIGDGKLFLDDVMVTNNDVFSVIQQPNKYELEQEESTSVTISANVGTGETKETLVVIPNNDPDESPYSFDLKFIGVEMDVKWLFMMYMAGDNNLANQLWTDMNEMENGLYHMDPAVLDTVRVLVLWDGNINYPPHPAGGKLYELGPDPNLDDTLGASTIDYTAEKWWSGDEVDMGSGDTLKEFINWARSQYPSYQYDIINMSGLSNGLKGIDLPNREGWNDDENNTSLYTNEIQQAFINAGCTNNRLSIISMDTCIMANVEEAYEYRDVADFFVATPENIDGDGFEYNGWLPDISTNSTPIDLAQILVESLRDDVGGAQALTAVDLSQIYNLKIEIDELAEAIVAENDQTNIMNVIDSSYVNDAISTSPSWYLGDLFDNLVNASFDQTLTGAAVDAHTALSQAIVYSWRGNYTDGYTYDGTGTTTYEGLVIQSSNEPWYTSAPYNDYGEIDFCNTTDDGTINTWKELLEAWY